MISTLFVDVVIFVKSKSLFFVARLDYRHFRSLILEYSLSSNNFAFAKHINLMKFFLNNKMVVKNSLINSIWYAKWILPICLCIFILFLGKLQENKNNNINHSSFIIQQFVFRFMACVRFFSHVHGIMFPSSATRRHFFYGCWNDDDHRVKVRPFPMWLSFDRIKSTI